MILRESKVGKKKGMGKEIKRKEDLNKKRRLETKTKLKASDSEQDEERR